MFLFEIVKILLQITELKFPYFMISWKMFIHSSLWAIKIERTSLIYDYF